MDSHKSPNGSWINGLAQFLTKRSDVQAIIVDPSNRKLSVASDADLNLDELKKHLHKTIETIEAKIASGQTQTTEPFPSGLSVKQLQPSGTLLKKDDSSAIHWTWRDVPWPEPAHDHDHADDWRFLAALAALCAFFGIVAFGLELFNVSPNWLVYSLYGLAMVAGGWDAAIDLRHKLPKGELDIHFLMLAVAAGASAIGAFREGALLLFLFSTSGALEGLAQNRTRRAIESLFKVAPQKASVLMPSGEEEEIPIDQVKPNMTVVVRPGQLFPVDAIITDGETAADESNLTGESVPVQKGVGDEVFSGTLNEWGAVHVNVIRPASQSSLQRIINLIQEAQHLKAPSQRFTDRFGTPYTYLVLSIVTVMFFTWWLGFGISPFTNTLDTYSAFYRAMTLLVVASPCALVLSVPTAILAAIAWGASHGILFRGGAAIEKLSEIDIVALDKTGTLTTGNLEVVKVESFPPGKETDIAEIAYSLEKKAHHPIARAIVNYGRANDINERELKNFKSITGAGVEGSFAEGQCVLGRRALLEMGPLAEWVKALPPSSEEFTEVWVIYEDLIGRIILKDTIRMESKSVLDRLKKLGIKTLMLTGDRRETAESVGKQLGLQEVRYSLKPEEKVAIINNFTKEGKKVAMVGDGVNDAPSLAAAYVAVAMGARGSDAALEQSEVILMNDRIDYFLNAYELSLRSKRIIRINLTISLVAIVAMLLAGTFGLVPLTLGVITHEGSTLLVCLNSLRLLR